MPEAKEIKTGLVLLDLRAHELEHDHFRVVRVFNSTRYQIGECLNTDTVDMLIGQDWAITIQ